jgi:hypothetical protein
MEWAASVEAEASLLCNEEERLSQEAFETFYTGLWSKAGTCNVTMPPRVPRHTGQILTEVTPQDIRLTVLKKIKKDSAPGPDGITKSMVQSMRAYPEVFAITW